MPISRSPPIPPRRVRLLAKHVKQLLRVPKHLGEVILLLVIVVQHHVVSQDGKESAEPRGGKAGRGGGTDLLRKMQQRVDVVEGGVGASPEPTTVFNKWISGINEPDDANRGEAKTYGLVKASTISAHPAARSSPRSTSTVALPTPSSSSSSLLANSLAK